MLAISVQFPEVYDGLFDFINIWKGFEELHGLVTTVKRECSWEKLNVEIECEKLHVHPGRL